MRALVAGEDGAVGEEVVGALRGRQGGGGGQAAEFGQGGAGGGVAGGGGWG